MKKLIFVIALMLVGCGQEQINPIDISMTEIVWEGPINADPSMLSIYSETQTCLFSYGFTRNDYPNIIITKDPFICGYRGLISGCTNFKTIYIQQDLSCNSLINKENCEPLFLKHEIVHWITFKDDSYHDTDYFQSCATNLRQI